MRFSLKLAAAVAAVCGAAVLAAAPAAAKCKRLAFSVNDYGKDGPTRDAKALLDKYIATWAGEHKIAKYTTGKKDVNCELFLNFIVFDEHTCRAEATVCWDENAPGVLLKFGKAVSGGAGSDGDIVGFTTVCPHKGFPMSYNAADHTFNCPGHYSRFDAEAGGMQIWGQATQNLPQYTLRVDDKGDIYAEGLDELLYGRLSNVL